MATGVRGPGRRARLLDAAVDLSARAGAQRLSIVLISSHAGVSLPRRLAQLAYIAIAPLTGPTNAFRLIEKPAGRPRPEAAKDKRMETLDGYQLSRVMCREG
jgi:hypothetical protein